ncbi:MAG TPA: alpha/beta fold hydrolase [Povalibacter sp.]
MKNLLLLLALLWNPASQAAETEVGTVVLLHGLARSAGSMSRMAEALEARGYHVCNIDYPSRDHAIEVLTTDFVAPAVKRCMADSGEPVHFVTHSLGGIVVRQLAASDSGLRIGRVVMLSPPNQGSEVVDKLGTLSLFQLINGPAGNQLGTSADSLPRRLGTPAFEFGIITGTRSVNPLLSLLIPGDDDGKVSVTRARLAGMKDFLAVRSSHPFIMKNRHTIEQTLRFLHDGTFEHNTTADHG